MQWSKKRCRILLAIGVVLALALACWTVGFVYMVVFPPMSFGLGYYVMNHRLILNFFWVAVAILFQLSPFGIEANAEGHFTYTFSLFRRQ